MKNRINPFFIFILVASFSCDSSDNYSTIPEILVDKSFKNKVYVAMSDFIEDIEYIVLETNEENMIYRLPAFFANDSIIIVSAFRQIFLFERKTGKFIREISRFGRGPGEYGVTSYVLPYDKTRGIINAYSWDMVSINEYDLSGNYLRTIKAPDAAITHVYFKDNIYASFIRNYSDEKRRILLSDENGRVIKTFPNYNFVEPSTSFASWGSKHGWFYRFHDELCFFELFTDTIYSITENQLIPRFVFKMGEYAPPYEKQKSADFMRYSSMNYFLIHDIFESENYLIFKITFDEKKFLGLYNKISESSFFAQGNGGFENDIDEFIPFNYSSINNHGELIGYAEGYEIELWFKNNPEKAAQLPPHLKKLENITEADNPVVIIGRLKE